MTMRVLVASVMAPSRPYPGAIKASPLLSSVLGLIRMTTPLLFPFVSRWALFHIAIVFVMGIFCFIGIVKVVIGDLVAQFVLVVAFAGEVL